MSAHLTPRQRKAFIIGELARMLAIAIIALGFILFAVAQNAKDDRVVEQDRKDQLAGCMRNADRVEAIILALAGDAVGHQKVADDPAQPRQTREARAAGAATHWDAVTTLAVTLVDCDLAFPRGEHAGVERTDRERLQRIYMRLEQRFGRLDPKLMERVAAQLREKLAAP